MREGTYLIISVLIQTYNVEDPVFDLDELTTSKIGGFIDWLQFYHPVEEAGVNTDDEDVGAIEDATGEKVKPLDDCGILVFCDGIKGLPSLSR